MAAHVLAFERPVVELVARVRELRDLASTDARWGPELERLEEKAAHLAREVFANLSPMQKVQLSRHPSRPYTLDYVARLFSDFFELKGDRRFADDASIVAGLGRFHGRSVAVVGHQKGRSTKENVERNFGMPHPEGYRKAIRIYELAERFGLPVFTFIDTPGAFPGIGAEERGQSEAIAASIETMSRLGVPVITTVIGEGGSGGALAISVADQVLMLQFAVYSVISPEGCASILWKTAERASDAAEALGITAHRLKALGLIDKIVSEPVGGAHRDPRHMASQLKRALVDSLRQVIDLKPRELVQRRYERLQGYGRFADTKQR